MFHLTEYQELPKKLAHRLPWGAVIDPGLILNKPGSLQKTIRYQAPDLYSSTESELDSVSAQVNNALMRLGEGWAYFIENQRRKYNKYPESEFPTTASKAVDKSRRRQFLENKNQYMNEYYFTFSYMTPTESSQKISARFLNEPKVDYRKHVEYFLDEVSKITDILKSVFPSVECLDDDETLTYLHSCISTKNHRVVLPHTPVFLDYLLCDEVFTGGLTPKIGDSYLKIITIMGFPLETQPQFLNELDRLEFEFRWVTRWICMDKNNAVSELRKYAKQWFAKRKPLLSIVKEAFMNEVNDSSADDSVVGMSQECNAMADMVAGGIVSAGYYTMNAVVWDEDIAAVIEKAKSIEQVLNSNGFVARIETLNAVNAWLSTLPGHCWANIRRPIITSMNLAHLIPISADWPGQSRNKHLNGPSLFYAKTKSRVPFRYTTHVGDVGHTMILGPTGTGKSVLLCFMATQFLRYKDAQVYIFDKDRSSMVTTLLNGGGFYDLGENTNLCFQPLADIDDEAERSWASEWIVELLAQERVTITPKIKSEVWDALNNLAQAPKHQRTLTGMTTLVQNKDIREALKIYTINGSFGMLVDSDKDSMNYGHWQSFEMNHLMQYMPGAVQPTLSYLFHKLEQRFIGVPTMLLLDECWLFLQNPIFAAKIKDWLKTLRKKNVSVIFATQSLSDAVESSIFSTLVESCPTRIFLPNKKAVEEDIGNQYRRFGLNEKQIRIISEALPKREYYCQSDLGCRLFELDMDPVTLAICGSTAKTDHNLINDLTGQEDILKNFLGLKGVLYEDS